MYYKEIAKKFFLSMSKSKMSNCFFFFKLLYTVHFQVSVYTKLKSDLALKQFSEEKNQYITLKHEIKYKATLFKMLMCKGMSV